MPILTNSATSCTSSKTDKRLDEPEAPQEFVPFHYTSDAPGAFEPSDTEIKLYRVEPDDALAQAIEVARKTNP